MQKRKKAFLAGIALCALAAIALGWYNFNKPHTNAASVKADVQVSADKLFTDYTTAETEADKIYLNKIVEVTGAVSNVAAAQHAIMLAASNGGSVNCVVMNDDAALQKISNNNIITIKGKCAGFLIDVNLVDCVITK